MINDLRILFSDLVQEFLTVENEILANKKIHSIVINGYHPIQGTKRDSGGASMINGTEINVNFLSQLISSYIRGFISCEKIYLYIIDNKLWHIPYTSYDENSRSFPSINASICAGFMSRLFVLNNYSFRHNSSIIEQLLQELVSFLERDYVEIFRYFHLKGVHGIEKEIVLTKNISIIQADYNLTRQFRINYDPFQHFSIGYDIYEDDYLLRFQIKIPKIYYNHKQLKKDFTERTFLEHTTKKWKVLPALTLPKFVDIGKELIISDDWPVISINAPGPFGNDSNYPNQKKYNSINDISATMLIDAAKIFDKLDFNLLEKKIIYAIERIEKSKRAMNLNDKVVELSIAFEYLINTTKSDVILQLCLKIIRLIDENNQDETIFKSLKKFYNLRSQIIHGNNKVDETDANILIVELAESIIQKAAIKLIDLNRIYSYSSIDNALTKSLHISKKFSVILAEDT